ncbi:MAG: hypothetical protein NVS4B8_30680 [Herpetosiphon sp.]
MGETLAAAKLGSYPIDRYGVILPGKPMVLNKDNVDKFNF